MNLLKLVIDAVSGRKLLISNWLLYLASLTILCSCEAGKREFTDFQPYWDSTKVLENPGKGWYHHLFDNNISRYAVLNDSLFEVFPGMDHVYLRLAWSFLEPEEGVYNWDLIDKQINKYVQKGYGVSFRITCKERGGYPEYCGQLNDDVHYATPVWVREAGAKGVEVINKGGILSWCPDWDDPVFLEKLECFHKAFAQRYDDKPWVRYVDIGSIGDYGEGHTNPSTGIPPDFDEVKANIDLYLRNYNDCLLIAPDGLFFWEKEDIIADSLFKYATDQGISVRDDSPMVGFWLKKELATWSIGKPRYYDPLYKKKPTILELQHYSAVKRDGNWLGKNGRDTIPGLGVTGAQVFLNAIKTMHATYIGYHGFSCEFLRDNPELTGELLNHCGYWYFPVSAGFPSRFKKNSNTISFRWFNKGVAPAYKPYAIIFKLENNEGRFMIQLNDSGNMNWMPGEVHIENYLLRLPDTLPDGKYKLSFKLMDMNPGMERDILLGIDNSLLAKDNFIFLGTVNI